jgi:hypothetical protein
MREKEAVQLEKAGKVRETTGRGGPPVAPPKKCQLPPTKVGMPEPFSGFQMTILTVLYAYESKRCKKPSNPGTACGKPQPKALLLQPLLRLLQA